VLQAVVEQTRRCTAGTATRDPAIDAAARRLRQRARVTAESAETDLETAAELWSRYEPCHDATPEARALTHILQRVGSEAGTAS
jgi:hypothetical protein